MSGPVRDLVQLLRSMQPLLRDEVYVFCCVPEASEWPMLDPIATFREAEGRTLVLEEKQALAAGLPILFRAAWITLEVHSDLQAVGLTAAVAVALTEANISCNVIAAAFHDHLFVPVESAQRAMDALRKIQLLGESQ